MLYWWKIWKDALTILTTCTQIKRAWHSLFITHFFWCFIRTKLKTQMWNNTHLLNMIGFCLIAQNVLAFIKQHSSSKINHNRSIMRNEQPTTCMYITLLFVKKNCFLQINQQQLLQLDALFFLLQCPID